MSNFRSVNFLSTLSRTGMRSLALVALLVASIGCPLLDSPDTAIATISVTATSTSLVAGTTMQVSAVARNKGGGALSGKPLTFASSNPSILTVSASGLVTVVGGVGTATLTAQGEGVLSTTPLAITVTAAAAANVARIGTDPTSIVAGFAIGDSVRVQVTDAFGNARSGTTVSFAVTAGGGSVSPATAVTDSSGKASARFTAGATAGTNSATATVSGLTPVTFSFTSIPNVGSITLNTSALPSTAGSILSTWIDPNGGSHDFRLDSPGTPITLANLAPGVYTINWNVPYCGVQGGCGQAVSWGPSSATQRITVVASTTPIAATMAYVPTTGIIQFSVPGLDSRLYGTASVVVGQNTRVFTISAGATQNLNDVPPGTYTVNWQTADCGVQGGCGNPVTWGPQSATQSITVVASLTPNAAAMPYVPKTGIIRLSISGIPTTGIQAGNSGLVHITINDGRAQRDWYINPSSPTVDVNNVPPGSYTLGWDVAYCGYQGGCGTTYYPSNSLQTITVSASTTPVAASMAYHP